MAKKAVAILPGKYKDVSESALRQALAAEGYEVFAWQDHPGNYYAPHDHPHDEYIVVWKGAIVFKIDGRSYEVTAGDALVLPAHTVHEAINESDETVRYFICS